MARTGAGKETAGERRYRAEVSRDVKAEGNMKLVIIKRKAVTTQP